MFSQLSFSSDTVTCVSCHSSQPVLLPRLVVFPLEGTACAIILLQEEAWTEDLERKEHRDFSGQAKLAKAEAQTLWALKTT